MASFILMGATGKMILDAGKIWLLPAVTGSVALGLVVYAVVRLLKGRVRHREESVKFERMMALRRELDLDNPDALLPQR